MELIAVDKKLEEYHSLRDSVFDYVYVVLKKLSDRADLKEKYEKEFKK